MSVREIKYYRVGGELKEQIDVMHKEQQRQRKAYADLCRDLGGTGRFMTNGDGGFSSFIEFEEAPDSRLWTNTGCGLSKGFRPKRSTKEGKAIHERLAAARPFHLLDKISKATVGRVGIVFSDFRYRGIGALFHDGETYLKVPVPSKKNSEQWTLHDDLVEITADEFETAEGAVYAEQEEQPHDE